MANNIWKGGIGNWDVTTNWSSGAPTGDDEIDSGDAEITTSVTSQSLLLNPAGRVTLETGGSLTTGNLVNHGDVFVDTQEGQGDSSLTIGASDKLTNTGILQIGDSDNSLSAATVVQAGSIVNTVGAIRIYGGATASDSALLISGAAAGLGTVGSITGDVDLSGYSALVFASGQISTIAAGGTLSLNGPHAFVADKTSSSTYTSNTALAGLTTIHGALYLNGAASVTTTQALTNYGYLYLSNGDESLQTSLTIGGNLTNNGSVDVGGGGEGFDTLTVKGTLTNNGSFELSTSDDAATVNAQALVNTGSLDLSSAAPTSSFVTLDVASAAGFGTAGVVTGSVRLSNNATIEFASGELTTIAKGATLALAGDDVFIADAGSLSSNSALTGLTSVLGTLELSSGVIVTTSAGLTVTGELDLDSGYYGGLGISGGSSLTVNGALVDNGSIAIGDEDLDFGDSVTVNSLTVTGSLSVAGAPGAESVLDVKSAAGFGTAGVTSGDVSVGGNAVIEFASGEITTIKTELTLAGPAAFIADASALTSNSALTGLTSVLGSFYLDLGAKVTTSAGLTVKGAVYLDVYDSDGGSSLTVDGALVDSGEVAIGSDNLEARTAITSSSLVVNDILTMTGVAGVAAAVFVVEGAAGTGAAGVLTGDIDLSGDAEIKFSSGEITTIKGTLDLIGKDVFIADASAVTSNSALTGLTTVTGALVLDGGASVTTSAGLTVSGTLEIDTFSYDEAISGGSSLTVTGALVDSDDIDIGNDDTLSANVTVTANSLVVNDTLDLSGVVGGGAAVLDVKGAAGTGGAGILTGDITLSGNAAIDFASGEITDIKGQLDLEGAQAFIADGTSASNSALTGLQTISSGADLRLSDAEISITGSLANSGILTLVYGAAVTVSAGLTNSDEITLDEYDYSASGTIGGSTLTVGGALTNNSEIILGSTNLAENVELTAGSLTNQDFIELSGDGAYGAVINATGGFANSSNVYVEGGTQSIAGAVTGSGLFEFESEESTLDFTGSVASGQTVDFDQFASATETLNLGDAAQFSASIDGFAVDDNLAAGTEAINLSGFGGSTTWALSSDVLTFTDGSKTAKITFTGSTYSLSDFHIGNSGTTTFIHNA